LITLSPPNPLFQTTAPGKARNGMSRRNGTPPTHINEKSQPRERFWLWISWNCRFSVHIGNTFIARAPQFGQ